MEVKPLISVIMGIYNCENTLLEALNCIASQTYSHWEIIMCDDASQDSTAKIAEAFSSLHPGKARLLKNDQNLGLNATLNKCLQYAKGDYIARMDGDDRCSPERFEIEIKTFQNHPDLAIVSSDMVFFDEKGIWGRTKAKEYPQPKDFTKGTPFCHAACMVRKEAYDRVGGYTVDKKLLRVEDYHLWVKMYEMGYRGINIQKPLYQMRDDRNAQARKKLRYRFNEAYVKAYAIKAFHLRKLNYFYCAMPIVIGLLPDRVYKYLHRKLHADSAA